MLKSLNNKMLKVIAYVLIALFLIVNIYRYTYQNILTNNYTETFDRSVKQYNLSITDFFSNLESAAEMLSKNELIQYVSDEPERYYDSTLELLKNFYQVYDSTAFAYFTPENKIFGTKKLISWPDTSETLSSTTWEAKQRPWYINAINAAPDFVWTKPYIDTTTNKHVITGSKTVTDKENAFKGVLAIDIYLDDLSDLIHHFETYNEGSIFILLKMDDDHLFIMDNLDNSIPKSLLSDDLITQIYQAAASSFSFENNSSRYYVSYVTNPTTGWKIIGIMDNDKFSRATTSLFINLLAGITAILIISFVSIVYIKKQIGSTIQTLSGSILATEEQQVSQTAAFIWNKLESEDLLLDDTTIHINLLFHIEAEKENIRLLTKDIFSVESLDINAIQHSLRKLSEYKGALNLSLKSHEIQRDSLNHFLLELRASIETLRLEQGALREGTELNHLENLISSILANNFDA